MRSKPVPRTRVVVATLLVVALVGAIAGLAAAGVSPRDAHSSGPRASIVAMRRHGRPALCRVTPEAASNSGRRPLLVAVGASFTAGVGAGRPASNWAVRLAEMLNWRAVTLGDPGAGYSAHGEDGIGPLWHELEVVHLASLHPALVIIQAGHDDWRVPAPTEARRVASLVRRIEADAPGTRIAFITVFSHQKAGRISARLQATDVAIIRAVEATDRAAIIIDPLHWRFPRAGDGLHPTARGALVVAERTARELKAAGALPRTAPVGTGSRPPPATVTCSILGLAHPPRAFRASRHHHLVTVGTPRPVCALSCRLQPQASGAHSSAQGSRSSV